MNTVAAVTRRTPGFTGWQQEGDAPRDELLTTEARRQLTSDSAVSEEHWAQFVEAYRPGGDPAVYLFRCLVCGARLFHMDFS